MDISDLTSKASPEELGLGKDFVPNYSSEVLKTQGNCVSIVDKAVKDNGLTMDEFQKLKVKNANELTTDECKLMKEVRESIEMPSETTIFQKAINIVEYKEYLKGKTTVKGFVSRAQDTAELENYDDYYDALRLDYKQEGKPPNFNKDTDVSMFVIRFKTNDIDEEYLEIPYNMCLEGRRDQIPPCTGNGFIASSKGKIIPEYRFKKEADIFIDAEIYEIPKKGKERLVAVYVNKYNSFREIMIK